MKRPGVPARGVLGLVLAVTGCTVVPSGAPPVPSAVGPSSSTSAPAPTDGRPDASTTPSEVAGSPFESIRYGYRLVIPDGWSRSETPGSGGLHPDEPGVDTFRSGDGRILSVVGESIAVGTGLDTWTCAISRHLSDDHDAPAESTQTIDMAGGTARLTRSHLRFDPYVVLYLVAEVAAGSTGLTLVLESTADDDLADEALFRSLVASLTLTG